MRTEFFRRSRRSATPRAADQSSPAPKSSSSPADFGPGAGGDAGLRVVFASDDRDDSPRAGRSAAAFGFRPPEDSARPRPPPAGFAGAAAGFAATGFDDLPAGFGSGPGFRGLYV